MGNGLEKLKPTANIGFALYELRCNIQSQFFN
jgi:hypothetical protein